MTFMDQIGLAAADIAANTAADAVVLAMLRALPFKLGVKAASTANVTIATGTVAGQTIDGVTLVSGDRILLKDQTTGSENGIYVVQASGAATRATDFDASAEICGAFVPVVTGDTLAGKLYQCTNTSCTVGTTAITFVAMDLAASTSISAFQTTVNNTLAASQWKSGVNAASTANVTISTGTVAGQTIDDITLVAGMRVLLQGQTDAKENGIYVVQASGAATRATDFDASAEICGAFVPVLAGTANKNKLYQCTNVTCTVGTDNIVIVEKTFPA